MIDILFDVFVIEFYKFGFKCFTSEHKNTDIRAINIYYHNVYIGYVSYSIGDCFVVAARHCRKSNGYTGNVDRAAFNLDNLDVGSIIGFFNIKCFRDAELGAMGDVSNIAS